MESVVLNVRTPSRQCTFSRYRTLRARLCVHLCRSEFRHTTLEASVGWQDWRSVFALPPLLPHRARSSDDAVYLSRLCWSQASTKLRELAPTTIFSLDVSKSEMSG